MSSVSWTFSLSESGHQHLAGRAGDGLSLHLDMDRVALQQMNAAEFLAMLERRAAEESAPVPASSGADSDDPGE